MKLTPLSWLDGNAGNDYIDGGTDNDAAWGDEGSDVLLGGALPYARTMTMAMIVGSGMKPTWATKLAVAANENQSKQVA